MCKLLGSTPKIGPGRLHREDVPALLLEQVVVQVLLHQLVVVVVVVVMVVVVVPAATHSPQALMVVLAGLGPSLRFARGLALENFS